MDQIYESLETMPSNKTRGKTLIKTPGNNFINIYNSDNTKNVLHDQDRRAAKRSRDANHPVKTGVIPPFYNQKDEVRTRISVNKNEPREGFENIKRNKNNKNNKNKKIIESDSE